MKQYSLLEFSELIQEAVEDSMPQSYWVSAEIASLSEKGGHLYLDLIEKGQHGMLSAKQRATCWSNVQMMLQAYFEQETGSRLQVGMQVLIEVEVRCHPLYGLSLNMINIDPTYTLGDLARQRQETLIKLQQEGVIDMQKALELPILTRRIAVISSESAAGYGDFCDQLMAKGYRFETTLFPAIMQGDNAEASIIAALDTVIAQEEEFDAIVIIRGGGATSDLSCFDSYNLCAHCAQSPLPILSGIGHTRDVSVLDMVAHLALKTPTAVASFLNERMDAQWNKLDEIAYRLQQTAARQILIRQNKIDLLEQRIESCNPERIYRKGYSLVTKNGKILRSIDDIQEGDVITTHLKDGQIESVVQ